MDEMTQYNIRGVSFDQFVAFLFRSTIAGKHEKYWYWEAEVTFDPAEMAAHYVKLFTGPQFLLEKFSKQVLEEAFWAIQVINLDCSANNIIWMEELPFSTRATCVQTMFCLFERL